MIVPYILAIGALQMALDQRAERQQIALILQKNIVAGIWF